MSFKPKASTVILTGLIFLSLALGIGIFMLLQKERAHNIELQDELKEVQAELRESSKKLKDLELTNTDLKDKLGVTQVQLEGLTADFEKEKAAKGEALANIERLRADLEQQKQLRLDLEKQFAKSKEEAKKVQEQVRQLDQRKSELEAKVKDLEARASDVELGTIVVNADQQAAPAPASKKGVKATPREKTPAVQPVKAAPIPQPQAKEKGSEGKVLVVNKEYNFLVFDLGRKDGIEQGAIFSVFHSNKYVGDVKVEKVHDAMSAAGFLTSGLRDKVAEGDRVSSRAR